MDQIRHQTDARKIEMAAMSGTFNMIHPDLKQRRQGLQRLPVLAAACRQMGVPIITLCTGTRDPHDMWRAHPDNQTQEAWRDLVDALSEALSIAEQFNLILGFEPEVSNVVDSARKGRRLLIGFAAETNDLEAAGRRKLQDKRLDLIVVNEVGRAGTGFGSETNEAMILSATGDDVPLRTWTKRELANAILDRVAKLLTG